MAAQIGRFQCGEACYAQHFLTWRKKGHSTREWGDVVYLKNNADELYLKEVQTNAGKGIGLFVSSVTEPLPPHSRARAVTKSILKAMLEIPPGRGIIIQTHTSYAASPDILGILKELSRKTSVLVSISIETNREHIRGLIRPCCSIKQRLNAFRTLADNGIATQASISPIMPCTPQTFARLLKENGVWRVILDHWEIGDGSCGARTDLTGVPQRLSENGYSKKWFSANVLDELEPAFIAQGFPGGVGRKSNYFALIPPLGVNKRRRRMQRHNRVM